MKICGIGLLLVTCAGVAHAQTTVTLTATSYAAWTDPNPPAAVTKYTGNVFLKTAVTGGTEPTSTPAVVLDFGKPPPAADGTIASPPLKPLVPANVELILFVHVTGPGGVSGPSNASVPFLGQAPPQPAAGLALR